MWRPVSMTGQLPGWYARSITILMPDGETGRHMGRALHHGRLA